MNMVGPMMCEFSYDYLRNFVERAQRGGYRFYTVRDFLQTGCPEDHAFVMKHDIDRQPSTLAPLLDVERELGIRSTLYARVSANEYNVMSYPVMRTLRQAERDGFEVGLHTNFYEYAMINDLDPLTVLRAELTLMRHFFDVQGISTHRDFNYAFNALPWLEAHWTDVSQALQISYQAYDPRLMGAATYINEGMKPHLTWRNDRPEDVIETGKSIYMLTHNHWWYDRHPFEVF